MGHFLSITNVSPSLQLCFCEQIKEKEGKEKGKSREWWREREGKERKRGEGRRGQDKGGNKHVVPREQDWKSHALCRQSKL